MSVVLAAAWLASAAATTAAVDTQPAPAQRMIEAAIAGDKPGFDRAVSLVHAQPKPPRGDRRVARELNERGLALWQRQRFAEAASVFERAHASDPSDAEVVENLGYALLKAGEIDRARAALLGALALDPERASAWGSLGQVYAKQDRHREGLACVLTAYRFSRDKARTLDVYSRLARADDDPRVRALLSDAVARISGSRQDRS